MSWSSREVECSLLRKNPKYSYSKFPFCNLAIPEAECITWGTCLESTFGFWEDLVLREILKRHEFVYGKDLFPALWEGPHQSQLIPAAMTQCAEVVAKDTCGLQGQEESWEPHSIYGTNCPLGMKADQVSTDKAVQLAAQRVSIKWNIIVSLNGRLCLILCFVYTMLVRFPGFPTAGLFSWVLLLVLKKDFLVHKLSQRAGD